MDARRIENLEVGVNEIVLKLNEIGKILTGIKGPVFPWVKPPPRTKEEFLQHLNDLIKENGLTDLYPPGDPRLDRLAQKAADRLKDSFTDGFLDKPEDVSGLVEATLYDHIMFCDDSGSMRTDNRKEHLQTLIGRVARVTSYLDNDGVSVRFINYTNDAGFNGLTTVDEVISIIKSVPFDGSTRLGTKLLEKVVDPMIISHINNKTFKKPVLVTVVTDGEPNEEPENALQTTILKCIQALTKNGYNPRSVRFQISQVGNAEAAKKFLLALQNDKDIRGNLHVTAEKIDVQLSALNANHRDLERWVLSYLLAPIRIR